jgi:hypothetical protein
MFLGVERGFHHKTSVMGVSNIKIGSDTAVDTYEDQIKLSMWHISETL